MDMTILYSFISALMPIVSLYNLRLVNLNYKDLIFLNALNFVSIYLSLNTHEVFGIPAMCMVIFLYLFLKNRKFLLNIITIIIAVSLVLLIDMLTGYFFLNIFNISIQALLANPKLYSALHITVLALVFIISKSLGIIIKKVNISSYYLKKQNPRLTILLMMNITTALITMYVFAMLNKFENHSTLIVALNVILFIIYFLSTITITLFYGNYVKREISYQHKLQEFSQLQEYTSMLEYTHNEMRKFKHDYINIISTINGYIEERDLEILEQYFNDKILPLNETIANKNTKLGLLQHIKIVGLKGLLSSKILEAQNKNIDVIIDIIEDIKKVDIDIIDLCRAVGILLDNAKEAAELCKVPTIKFGIITRKNSIIFVIINSCPEDVPPIFKIFQKGFSTKGKNRGLGLHTLKEMVDKKYNNITLNTSLEHQQFKQELIIRYTEDRKEVLSC